jgi:hypothetical protein
MGRDHACKAGLAAHLPVTMLHRIFAISVWGRKRYQMYDCKTCNCNA